jgi:hypothetical protein
MSDMPAVLKARGGNKLFLLDGVNSDSGLRVKTKASFEWLAEYPATDSERLYQLLTTARVLKTPAELDLIRAACYVSSQVGKSTRVGG